jgi:hypothetical protein
MYDTGDNIHSHEHHPHGDSRPSRPGLTHTLSFGQSGPSISNDRVSSPQRRTTNQTSQQSDRKLIQLHTPHSLVKGTTKHKNASLLSSSSNLSPSISPNHALSAFSSTLSLSLWPLPPFHTGCSGDSDDSLR